MKVGNLYETWPAELLLCFKCNKRKAKWLTSWGRLCGYCRRTMRAELRKNPTAHRGSLKP